MNARSASDLTMLHVGIFLGTAVVSRSMMVFRGGGLRWRFGAGRKEGMREISPFSLTQIVLSAVGRRVRRFGHSLALVLINERYW